MKWTKALKVKNENMLFPAIPGSLGYILQPITWSLPFPGGIILALLCNVLKSVTNASLSLSAPQLFCLQGDLFKVHKLPE